MEKEWKRYEDVARILLKHVLTDLQLERIEGKQKLVGLRTGTEWEVDAKGGRVGDGACILIESRRYTNSRLSQEAMAGIAFRVADTGAGGGIVVSPLPLQEGAKLVAAAANIVHVQIDANSTPENFGMRFLHKVLMGSTSTASMRAEVTMFVRVTCKGCGEVYEWGDGERVCPKCGSR